MATSGSYNFSLTAAQVIAAAYEDIGLIAAGGTVASADSVLALSRLNMIAKQYQGRADGSQGIPIMSRQRVTLMLAKGQQTYLIGPGSSDARASTAVGRTTLSAAEASGQTVLSITSNTDTTSYPGSTITMTASDIVGIELDDGTIQWTAISGTPASTMTVSVALTGDAAAGNYVWWFTARAQRFPVLETAVLRDENFNDTPLDIYTEVAQYEYGVSSKLGDGAPTCLLCEPIRTQTRITLNSQPTNVTDTIVLTVLYPSEDYDATTDDIAYPQEAFRFLTLELGRAIAPGGAWTAHLEEQRREAKAMFFGLNPENSTLSFEPGLP